MKPLMDLFAELSIDEGIQLEDFLDRVKAGEFEARPREELVNFLRELEQEMLQNIEYRIAGSPHLESMRESRIASTQKRIQHLIDGL